MVVTKSKSHTSRLLIIETCSGGFRILNELPRLVCQNAMETEVSDSLRKKLEAKDVTTVIYVSGP